MTQPNHPDYGMVYLDATPFDVDAFDPTVTYTKEERPQSRAAPFAALTTKPFLYIGMALTNEEFIQYVETYNFGNIPPDQIVIHHTAVPSATWARYPSGDVWDDGEAGMNDAQKKVRRLSKLSALRTYYRDTLNWDRGPHLFVDDKWVYLFTPMSEIGIHAAQGNSNHIRGRLHYSIGIEVVGYYEHVTWPAPVRRNVGLVIAALKRRLKTFDTAYKTDFGGICGHRAYNKPTCPGAAITNEYMIQVAQEGWRTLTMPDLPPGRFPVDPKFQSAWNLSGGIWRPNELTPGYALSTAFDFEGKTYQIFERGVARIENTNTVWLLATEWPGVMEAYQKRSSAP